MPLYLVGLVQYFELLVFEIMRINCIFIYFRHRKKRDFAEQEHQVKERNNFDKEHFSDAAAMFENPAYEDSGKTYRF